MRKVKIGGKMVTFRNSDEVTYGAEKKLERAQFAASLAMLSDADVAELATKSHADGVEIDEKDFMARVMSGEIKTALLDSHDAAVSPEEEAIILSADISQTELLAMPRKIVRELAKEAMAEMGTVEDFSKASNTDTN